MVSEFFHFGADALNRRGSRWAHCKNDSAADWAEGVYVTRLQRTVYQLDSCLLPGLMQIVLLGQVSLAGRIESIAGDPSSNAYYLSTLAC